MLAAAALLFGSGVPACTQLLFRSLIPGLSTTGTFTTFAPLMFFVGISIAKEGIDDLRRHKLDKAENNSDNDNDSSNKNKGTHLDIHPWRARCTV